MEKKHAPIKQLKEAGKEAERLLRERGIHTAESAIDRILAENKVILPGIPAYLPHAWTLEQSRRILRDIIKLWVEKNKGKQKKQENTEAFFAFLVAQLNSIEKATQEKVNKTPAILRSMTNKNVRVYRVFSSWQQLETTQAITRFMIDSYAVSMVVKEHNTTTQFVEWFFKWTGILEAHFLKSEKKDGQPILNPK
jgi:hypothetical protein